MGASSTSRQRREIDLVVLPVEVEIDNCVATILETTKYNLPWEQYQAAVQLQCNDVMSQIFHIHYANSRELLLKLKSEISKLKYMIWLYGKAELERRGVIKIIKK